MSLLMDALKKADENLKENTSQTPDKTDDILNVDEEPLFIETIEDSIPSSQFEQTIEDSIPSSQFEQTSESSLKDWNEELLGHFKDINFQKENETFLPEPNKIDDLVDFNELDSEIEKKRETVNWEDDILPQFQHDNEEKSEREVDEVESLEFKRITSDDEVAIGKPFKDGTIKENKTITEKQAFEDFSYNEVEKQIESKIDVQEFEQVQDDIFSDKLEEQQDELKTDVQKFEPTQEESIFPDGQKRQEKVKSDVPKLAETAIDISDGLKQKDELKTDMQKADVSKVITKKIPRPKDAQRILAASNPPSSSKGATWLYAILGILLVSMGAGYYYIENYLVSSPSFIITHQPKPKRNLEVARQESQQFVDKIRSKKPEILHQNQKPEILPEIETLPEKQLEILPETPPETPPVQLSKQTPPMIEEMKKPEMPTKAQSTKKPKTPISSPVQSHPIILNKKFELAQKKYMTTPSQKSPQKSAPSEKKSEKKEVPLSPQTPGIQIRKTVSTKINAELSKGYNAFQQNDDWTAQRAYTKVLQKDENNRDALLGLAAVALRKGNKAQAQHHYQRVLHLYPQDTYAQVGLINTLDHFSQETESQLKLLIKQVPQSAYIHFSLGNFYARKGRWAQAQKAYFNAYRYDKIQADYVYNLAISLDYLNKPSLALTYYKQALELASNQSVHFNPKSILKRMQTLNDHK
ncbi:MAG: hypothetical protein KAI83_11425 [Thiomargarita sp.]|nr:hypothetical protein [Thiomargarita sp.]